jgi:photosystem II stability/assembly factor-like uncharacterized protein
MQPRRSVLLAICIILFIYFEIHSCSKDEIASPDGPKPPVESIILGATDIYFHDADFGCVTGSLGTLMITGDSGKTWKGAVIDQGILSDIQFLDVSNGWLVGKDGALYTTADGGATWAKAIPAGYPPEEDFSKLYFVNESVGYILGYHGVYKTENAGASWQNNWLPAVPYRGAWDMSFIDDRTGFLLGSRYTDADPVTLYRTTDGAATWSEVQGAKTSVLRTILTVSFVDAMTGWAGGGVIMKTIDGGETWQTQVAAATVREFQFLDNRYGLAVGGRMILQTKDGGDAWQNITPNDERISDLRGVYFVDASNGWVVGRGKDERLDEKLYKHTIVLRTSDGGKTWQITDFSYDCTDIQNVEEAIGS